MKPLKKAITRIIQLRGSTRLVIAIFIATISAGYLSSCGTESFQRNQGDDSLTPARKPNESEFAHIQRTIIGPKCLSCHQGAGSPHGVDLSSYTSIVHSPVFPPLVVPGDPASSSLYTSVASGRMPKRRAPLSQMELELVRNWIVSGAKETQEPVEPPSGEPGEPPGELPGEPPGELPGEPPDEPPAGPSEPGEPPDDPF